MWLSTAYYLAQKIDPKKERILIIDQCRPGDDSISSYDVSRNFRLEYGKEEFYSQLAYASYQDRSARNEISSQELFVNTGSIILGETVDQYMQDTMKTFDRNWYGYRLFDQEEIQKEFGIFSAKAGLLDLQGGILAADKIMNFLTKTCKDQQVSIRYEIWVGSIETDCVVLHSWERVQFDELIVAGWKLTKLLLEEKYNKLYTSYKQHITYFSCEEYVDSSRIPSFAFLDEWFYGFPFYGIDALKIANHELWTSFEESNIDYTYEDGFLGRVYEFLEKNMSLDTAKMKVIQKKVCYYDVTKDSWFVIDKLREHIHILTGFSGHGFKFAPQIGKMVSDSVLGRGGLPAERSMLRGSL